MAVLLLGTMPAPVLRLNTSLADGSPSPPLLGFDSSQLSSREGAVPAVSRAVRLSLTNDLRTDGGAYNTIL